MKRKFIKTLKMCSLAAYKCALCLFLFFIFNSFILKPSGAEDIQEDLVNAPNPFGLPAMLAQLLDDMDRQVRAEQEEREKKRAEEMARLAKKSTEPVASSQEEIKMPSLKISGITWSERNPLVIINGTVLGVGDVIVETDGEAVIRSIEKNKVAVLFRGDIYILDVDGNITISGVNK